MPFLVLLMVLLSAFGAAAAGLAMGHSVWLAVALYVGVVELAALGALAAPLLARAVASGLARLSRRIGIASRGAKVQALGHPAPG